MEIRKELYSHVKKNVKLLLGASSPGLKRYEDEYKKEFKNKNWLPSHRSDLLAAIEKSRLIWIGDFHALQQSQKAQLRVLKSLQNPQEIIIFIECIESRHQDKLDLYLNGKLSEREFLKSVEWKKSWGFPWEYYKPLFKWAIKLKVPLKGVNYLTEDRSGQSLKMRDVFAAKKIAEEIQKGGKTKKYFIIFGDLHLASAHLPREVHRYIKNLKSLYIFQNPEEIYFELLDREIEHQVDVVRLGQNKFALTSVPPWVKWQNYLVYLESQYDSVFDDEDTDLTDYVAKYVKVISSDLETTVSIDHFEVVTAQDVAALERLRSLSSEKEFKVLKYWIESGRSFFHPSSGIAYLGSRSVNSASHLAMGIVFSQINKLKKIPHHFPQKFHHLIWLEAAIYFGTKLINPKRKTDTLNDIKAALMVHGEDEGRESMQLALSQKMLELLFLNAGRNQRELLRPRRFSSYLEAARILGGILGEKIFYGYRKKILNQKVLFQIFHKSLESTHFENNYWEILEIIDSVPEPFKSKREKM